MRAYSTTQYDDQQRLFATHDFNVNQSTGAISSTSQDTNYYYDHRGDLIETTGREKGTQLVYWAG